MQYKIEVQVVDLRIGDRFVWNEQTYEITYMAPEEFTAKTVMLYIIYTRNIDTEETLVFFRRMDESFVLFSRVTHRQYELV